MSPDGIRLRLTIRRHELPEVRLVWPCAVTEDLTIASLLSQVNEVITLESDQWGLKDYAVELADGNGGTFECLHFQEVGKVFKQDDQVLIRSLLTEDLRRRRISGRTQISTDGIHLVDGVPFGRRRAPQDRPMLSLPPRKRARIAYDTHENEPEHEEQSPGPLRLEGSHPAARDDVTDLSSAIYVPGTAHDDEDDDQEYIPGDFPENDSIPDLDAVDKDEDLADEDDDLEGDDDLEEEIRLLQADNTIIGDNEWDEGSGAPMNHAGKPARDLSPPEGQALLNPVMLNATGALRTAFPLTPISTIETVLQKRQLDIQQSYNDLAAANDPALSFDEVLHGFLAERFREKTSPPGSPALLPEAHHAQARPLIQEVESNDTPVAATTDYASTPVDVKSNKDRASSTNNDSSSSSDSSSGSGDDKSISSSDSDSSADDSSSGPSSSDSSGSDESDSDSDDSSSSSNDDESGKHPGIDHDSPKQQQSTRNESDEGSESGSSSSQNSSVDDSDESPSESSDSSSDDDSDTSSDHSDDSTSTGRASGSASKPGKATTGPNVTTGSSNAMQTKPSAPLVSTVTSHDDTVGRGQGLSKTQKRNARRREAKRLRSLQQSQSQSHETATTESLEQDIMARKKALLNAVTDDAPEPGPSNEEHDPTTGQEPHRGTDTEHDPSGGQAGQTVAGQADGQAQTSSTPENIPTPSEEAAPRRLRVDMGAGRRLLFGALGLKNPKTKDDEEKLKKDLMKNVRPLQNHRQSETDEVTKDANDGPEDDADSWREKITYRAVECCHEGVVLSEPPFPFVQRWDPQQQYGTMRKRKRGSQGYGQEKHDLDYGSYRDNTDGRATARESKKSKKRKSRQQQSEVQLNDENDEVELNYDDTPGKDRGSGSQFTDVEDLPSLPADITTLPSLQLDEIKTGMVITWKQFYLSKMTNWQPELIPVTGLVLSMSDDELLHLILAKRDREPDHRVYDDETGERIYDRFEAPDDSEDEEEEDSGHRHVSWSDMIEPRVVQREPSPSAMNSPVRETSTLIQEGEGTATNEGLEAGSPKPQSSSLDEMDSPQGANIEEGMADAEDQEVQVPGTSIPSGQGFAGIPPSVGHPSNNATETSCGTESQPQHVSTVVIKDSQPRQGSSNANIEDVTTVNEAVGPYKDSAMPNGAGSGDSPQHAPPSLNALSASPMPQGDDQGKQGLAVKYPQLSVPSPASSIHSGRQPRSNLGLTDPINMADESMMPENSGESQPEDNASERDSSPFPSLDEIWHTAHTSKQIQSPLKSSQVSALGKRKNKSGDYEEAMKRLDEGEESDTSPDRKRSTRSLFPNATQPPQSVGLPGLSSSEEPVRRSRRKSRRATSPSAGPEGAQITTLSPSPNSNRFTENYAEDSVDETYKNEDSPLPKGSGWVKKHRSASATVPKSATRNRGSGAPVTTTRVRPVPEPSSSRTARRKMSKKF